MGKTSKTVLGTTINHQYSLDIDYLNNMLAEAQECLRKFEINEGGGISNEQAHFTEFLLSYEQGIANCLGFGEELLKEMSDSSAEIDALMSGSSGTQQRSLKVLLDTLNQQRVAVQMQVEKCRSIQKEKIDPSWKGLSRVKDDPNWMAFLINLSLNLKRSIEQ